MLVPTIILDSYSPYRCDEGYCTPAYGNAINGTLHEVGIACIKDYPKCKAYQYSESRGYGHLCEKPTYSKSDDMIDYKSCIAPFGKHAKYLNRYKDTVLNNIFQIYKIFIIIRKFFSCFH